MSEIRILNLCHKKTILVDIYRQSLLINVAAFNRINMAAPTVCCRYPFMHLSNCTGKFLVQGIDSKAGVNLDLHTWTRYGRGYRVTTDCAGPEEVKYELAVSLRKEKILCLGVRFMHILPPPASTVDSIPCRVPHSNILSAQPLFVKRTTSLPRYFTKRSFKWAMYWWSHCSKDPYSFST